jgi:hypothetical protein
MNALRFKDITSAPLTLVEVTDKLNQLGARTIRALEDAPGCM